MDWYEVLKIDDEATKQQIKEKYQSLLLTLHPDKNDGKISQDFNNVLKAGKILLDDSERKKFDAERKSILDGQKDNFYRIVTLYEFNKDENMRICRCGRDFVMEETLNVDMEIVVECDTCSLCIKIILS